MPSSDDEILRDLERRRCEALVAADEPALAALLAEGLVHVHLNGRTDDKAGYLDGFRHKYSFRSVERGDLAVRVFGDAAVMTGPLVQTLLVRESGQVVAVTATTTQVWNRDGESWLLNTCHNAPVTA